MLARRPRFPHRTAVRSWEASCSIVYACTFTVAMTACTIQCMSHDNCGHYALLCIEIVCSCECKSMMRKLMRFGEKRSLRACTKVGHPSTSFLFELTQGAYNSKFSRCLLIAGVSEIISSIVLSLPLSTDQG